MDDRPVNEPRYRETSTRSSSNECEIVCSQMILEVDEEINTLSDIGGEGSRAPSDKCDRGFAVGLKSYHT